MAHRGQEAESELPSRDIKPFTVWTPNTFPYRQPPSLTHPLIPLLTHSLRIYYLLSAIQEQGKQWQTNMTSLLLHKVRNLAVDFVNQLITQNNHKTANFDMCY